MPQVCTLKVKGGCVQAEWAVQLPTWRGRTGNAGMRCQGGRVPDPLLIPVGTAAHGEELEVFLRTEDHDSEAPWRCCKASEFWCPHGSGARNEKNALSDVDKERIPRYAPGVNSCRRIWPGRLLRSEHVRLERHEVAADMEAAQLGDGGLMLLGPPLLCDRQAVGAAQQVGEFLLARRQQGVQDGAQAVTGEIREFQTSFLGRGFGGIQPERSDYNWHVLSMQV